MPKWMLPVIVVFVVLIGFLGVSYYRDSVAYASALGVCRTIALGVGQSSVQKKFDAIPLRGRGFQVVDRNFLMVVFDAAYDEQCVCYAKFANGVVSDKAVKRIFPWTK